MSATLNSRAIGVHLTFINVRPQLVYYNFLAIVKCGESR